MRNIKTAGYIQATKENNPWAICTKSTGRKDKKKYERCIKDVKKESKTAQFQEPGPKAVRHDQNTFDVYNQYGIRVGNYGAETAEGALKLAEPELREFNLKAEKRQVPHEAIDTDLPNEDESFDIPDLQEPKDPYLDTRDVLEMNGALNKEMQKMKFAIQFAKQGAMDDIVNNNRKYPNQRIDEAKASKFYPKMLQYFQRAFSPLQKELQNLYLSGGPERDSEHGDPHAGQSKGSELMRSRYMLGEVGKKINNTIENAIKYEQKYMGTSLFNEALDELNSYGNDDSFDDHH